jgi:HK97 gp10 family phage protein
MSTSFKFVVDQAGIKDVATGEAMRTFLDKHAERVLQEAQKIAPVETGKYRDSLSVTPAHETDGVLTAEVASSSWYWHFVEFGTVYSHGAHVLERAVTGSGLEFRPEGG